MANQYVNLPVPAGNGVGAAVDVSTFGALKTIVCGGNSRAQITVEFNNDAVPGGSWVALKTFQDTGQITLRVAARWMRVRVSGYNSYVGGQAVVDVGGTDDGSQFASLAVPAGNGTGAATNVSALGLFKTVQVGAAFRGSVIVEVSEDGNEWAQPFSFNGQAGFQSAVIAAEFMRVRRVGVPEIAPGTPVVNVGATDDFSGDDGVAISAGTQSVATGIVNFANSNGVSFGMSDSSRVTASVDAVRSIVGSGSTATGPSVSFANSNGVSFGISGQTVTASVAAGATELSNSQFQNFLGNSLTFKNPGNSNLAIYPQKLDNLAFSQVGALVQMTANAASVGTVSYTHGMGFYTRTGDSLSLFASTTFSTSVAFSTDVNTSLYAGARLITAGWTTTIPSNDYWIGVLYVSTTSSQNATFRLGFNQFLPGSSFSGFLGIGSNSSNQVVPGQGNWASATTDIPSSVAMSDIDGLGGAKLDTPAIYMGVSL